VQPELTEPPMAETVREQRTGAWMIVLVGAAFLVALGWAAWRFGFAGGRRRA
jgi:hypothetical protein